MKRQIRKGTFESNSSSLHSLVVTKDDRYYTKEEANRRTYISDGVMDICSRDLYFGRSPFNILSTLIEKSIYTMASMCNYKGDDVYTEICDVIRSYFPEFTGFSLPFKTRYYETKYCSEDDIIKWYGNGNYYKCDDKWICWGYNTGTVDENILSGFLERENISITEFLKNKKYVVIVDGDEYCVYNSLKKSGLINFDNIEKEYPIDKDVIE